MKNIIDKIIMVLMLLGLFTLLIVGTIGIIDMIKDDPKGDALDRVAEVCIEEEGGRMGWAPSEYSCGRHECLFLVCDKDAGK